jgi:hypothetical protein
MYNIRDIVVLAKDVCGVGKRSDRGYRAGQRVKIETVRMTGSKGIRYSIRCLKGDTDMNGRRYCTTCSPEDIKEKVGEIPPR